MSSTSVSAVTPSFSSMSTWMTLSDSGIGARGSIYRNVFLGGIGSVDRMIGAGRVR
jgi:hypothetical protein